MTDRLKGCIVAFEKDIREDDARPLLAAIRQLKGVASVSISIAHPDDYINRNTVRYELQRRLLQVLEAD